MGPCPHPPLPRAGGELGPSLLFYPPPPPHSLRRVTRSKHPLPLTRVLPRAAALFPHHRHPTSKSTPTKSAMTSGGGGIFLESNAAITRAGDNEPKENNLPEGRYGTSSRGFRRVGNISRFSQTPSSGFRPRRVARTNRPGQVGSHRRVRWPSTSTRRRCTSR